MGLAGDEVILPGPALVPGAAEPLPEPRHGDADDQEGALIHQLRGPRPGVGRDEDRRHDKAEDDGEHPGPEAAPERADDDGRHEEDEELAVAENGIEKQPHAERDRDRRHRQHADDDRAAAKACQPLAPLRRIVCRLDHRSAGPRCPRGYPLSLTLRIIP